ncbi:MAG: hypothetical protein LBI45_02535 [Bacteroidales bacterium]|jgi:hypothetical protein|nr:hypothetical protein [Bacteroidales bacterium]
MNKLELLLTLLEESVEKCYQQDFTLIDRSMERASVARIYYYMQDLLKNDNRFTALAHYNLDGEYNKNGERVKRTDHSINGKLPDIILHKRLSNSENTMILELKATRRDIENDFIKLMDFTNPNANNLYNYFLGVFVMLKRNTPQYTYFQNGKVTKKKDLNYE